MEASHTEDQRIAERADDGPAEERAPGPADRQAQAAAILADSDEREANREDSGDTVEHRRVGGDGEAQDR